MKEIGTAYEQTTIIEKIHVTSIAYARRTATLDFEYTLIKLFFWDL